MDTVLKEQIDVMMWVESFASCAIEGNPLAIEMMELWNTNKKAEFIKRIKTEWIPSLKNRG